MTDSNVQAAQHEQIVKLESIFTPIARKQRDEHFKRQPGSGLIPDSARFVHYTSADAALSIIRSKRLWMRNALCMSDYREVSHGFEILRGFFREESRKSALEDALEPCAPGILTAAVNIFDHHWKTNTFAHTYITSISEHLPSEDLHGRLSMWRAFGSSNAARVAIVLRIPWNSDSAAPLNLLFSPVAYLTETEAHETLFEVIENIKANADYLRSLAPEVVLRSVFLMLVAGATCLKHEGFKEEREWRAIYSPYREPSPLMDSSIEVISGVPQIVYKIPIDQTVSSELAGLDFCRIFDRLIIGPSPYGFPLYDAFRTALVQAGIPLDDARARVFNSGIPIRV